ncbi:MAG: hypothetical protein ABI411_09155 [Tahibacter sp.]
MNRINYVLLLCGLLGACGGAGSDPPSLAAALQKALSAGDFKAAAELVDMTRAPADVRFAYDDLVLECSSGATCTVATAPLDDAFRAELQADAKKLGADPLAAEGLMVVSSHLVAANGSSSGTMKLPYAKIGGMYKVSSLHLSEAEITRLRGKPSEDLLKEMFAEGIYDNASRERRTDWETAATRIAEDGGEAGKALVQQTAAMAAAVDNKDPDAAMRTGSQWAKIVFSDKEYDGKPIALDKRQRKLRVQSLRMLRDVKVKGAYQLGDDVALVVEARNGIGWIERGAILMSRGSPGWDVSGTKTISYPDK